MSESAAWDYGRSLPPYRWTELPDFEGGAFPAPIRLSHASAKDVKLGAITPKYLEDEAVIASMKGFFFENLHFEIEIDVKNGNAGGADIGGTYCQLLKLHFHIPAEHTIDGHPLSKMEVHLVHKSPDPASKGTVIGLMVEELTPDLKATGATTSPLVQFFRELLPKVTLPHADEKWSGMVGKESLNAGFPSKKSYFQYKGGLTTPPCSEPVYFHILDTPIYTTKEIIAKFAGYVPGGNNRPLQPGNGRPVGYFQG